MSVEAALYPSQLDTTRPLPGDLLAEGDDHIRLNKVVQKTTWPNVAGPVTVTHTELNRLAGITGNVQTLINSAGAASTAAAAASASAAAASAAQAASSATTATTAATTVVELTEGFDSLYLGPKTANPTVDNVGNPLVAGALHFNTAATPKEMRVYTGSVWQATVAPSAAMSMAIETGTTITGAIGTHHCLANAGISTVTLPAATGSGGYIWVTPLNGLSTNVIARASGNLMGLAENMTIDNPHVTVKLRDINTTVGWRIV